MEAGCSSGEASPLVTSPSNSTPSSACAIVAPSPSASPSLTTRTFKDRSDGSGSHVQQQTATTAQISPLATTNHPQSRLGPLSEAPVSEKPGFGSGGGVNIAGMSAVTLFQRESSTNLTSPSAPSGSRPESNTANSASNSSSCSSSPPGTPVWEWHEKKLVFNVWTPFSASVMQRLEISYLYIQNCSSSGIVRVDPVIRNVDVDESRYVDVYQMMMLRRDQPSYFCDVRRKIKGGDKEKDKADSNHAEDEVSSDEESNLTLPSGSSEYIWFWHSGEGSSWVRYSLRLSRKLEKGFSRNQARVRLDKDRYVEFYRMLQVHYDDPQRYRKVIRTPVTSPLTTSPPKISNAAVQHEENGTTGATTRLEELKRREEKLKQIEDRHSEEYELFRNDISYQQARLAQKHQDLLATENRLREEKARAEALKQEYEAKLPLITHQTRDAAAKLEVVLRRERQAVATEETLIRREIALHRREHEVEQLRQSLLLKETELTAEKDQLQREKNDLEIRRQLHFQEELRRQQQEQLQASSEVPQLSINTLGVPSSSTSLDQGSLSIRTTLGIFTSNQIKEATDGFNSDYIIGRGGFGPVYRGSFGDVEVAIKKLDLELESPGPGSGGGNRTRQGDSEFIQEMAVLAPCKHESIVPLLGVCLESKERCLVYPLMKGGTLEARLEREQRTKIRSSNPRLSARWIDCTEPLPSLHWYRRLLILRQVAEGLLYLHGSQSDGEGVDRIPVYHRDIKGANILLDADGNARLSDVGLARFAEGSSSKGSNPTVTHVNVLQAGTFGYTDPQFVGQYRAANDIYSFGVVILEVLTGYPAVVPPEDIHHLLGTNTPTDGGTHLLISLVKRTLTRVRDVNDFDASASRIADSRAGEWPSSLPSALAKLALQCVAEFREDRIDTAGLVQRLRGLCAEHQVGLSDEKFVIYDDSFLEHRKKSRQVPGTNTRNRPRVRDCVICLSEPSGACMLLPCRHAVTCLDCTRTLLSRPTNQRQCPICRTRIRELRSGLFYSTFVAPTTPSSLAGE